MSDAQIFQFSTKWTLCTYLHSYKRLYTAFLRWTLFKGRCYRISEIHINGIYSVAKSFKQIRSTRHIQAPVFFYYVIQRDSCGLNEISQLENHMVDHCIRSPRNDICIRTVYVVHWRGELLDKVTANSEFDNISSYFSTLKKFQLFLEII